MVIPRERATGDYLSRLFVQVQEQVKPDGHQTPADVSNAPISAGARARRAQVTEKSIF